MVRPLEQVGCASLPLSALTVLAEVRSERDVQAAVVGDRVWVRWPVGCHHVLRCALPAPGVELYVMRGGQWFRFGSRLPSPGWPPQARFRPLFEVLTPAPVEPEPPPNDRPRRCPVTLVRDTCPRHASTLRCALADLAVWAERATTAELGALRGARFGGEVILVGAKLPPIRGGRRFWGTRVLTPLGHRIDPPLPDRDLMAALEAGDDELVLIESDGFSILPELAFEPLTRAAVRMAFAEHT